MDDIIMKELVDGLRIIYGDVLVQVVLYGFVAKNTATKESDIDIAVLLKTDDSKEYEDALLI